MALYGLSPVTQMLDAVTVLLAPLTIEQGQYVRTLKRIPGNLSKRPRDDSFRVAIEQGLKGAPAIWLSADELSNIEPAKAGIANKPMYADLRLHVYCFGDHVSGRVKGRLEPQDRSLTNSKMDPGMDVFVHDTLCLLAGAAPLAGHNQLKPLDGEYLFNGDEGTIWEWRFDVRLQFSVQRRELEVFDSAEHTITTDENDAEIQILTQVLTP